VDFILLNIFFGFVTDNEPSLTFESKAVLPYQV
jgi:hypothetical protein